VIDDDLDQVHLPILRQVSQKVSFLTKEKRQWAALCTPVRDPSIMMEAGDQFKVAEIGNKPAYGTFGEPTKESPHDESKVDPDQDQSLRHRIFQFVHNPHSSTPVRMSCVATVLSLIR